jgi:hypothetical protein
VFSEKVLETIKALFVPETAPIKVKKSLVLGVDTSSDATVITSPALMRSEIAFFSAARLTVLEMVFR